MNEEWIITQTGAVKKSEINMILPQPNENGKINIVLVTKDKLSLLIYNDIETAYLATVIIDNLITVFDENHVPQIDLKKKQEEMGQEQEEEEPTVEEEEEQDIIEQPVIKPVTQAVKLPVTPKTQTPKQQTVKQQPKQTPAPAPAPVQEPAPSPAKTEDDAE